MPWSDRPERTSFVALPDTQFYAQDFPATFDAQTQWIVDRQDDLNIGMVFHCGDITNRNTAAQWANALRSMNILRGRVPFQLSQGNHDCGTNGSADNRSSLMSSYFPVTTLAAQPTFGGVQTPLKSENSYNLFTAAGRKWISIGLEWGPRDEVVAWANSVLAAHRDRLAIIVVHAYMNNDNTRLDRTVRLTGGNPYSYPTASLPGGVNDGGDLWRELVSLHPNVMFVFSGHISGEGRLSSTTPFGNVVHQVLADYQSRANGGEGYLRVMDLAANSSVVRFRTYSPTLDRYLTSTTSQFTLDLVTAPGFEGRACVADVSPRFRPDERLDIFDILRFFELFGEGHTDADVNRDLRTDIFDVLGFFEVFGAGCA